MVDSAVSPIFDSSGRLEHELPHLAVDVVQHDDPRAAEPQRAEVGDAVPHLDQAVDGAVAPDRLLDDGRREHHVAAGPADDLVAVAGRCAAGGPGRRTSAWSRSNPAAAHRSAMRAEVQLRAAGLDVDQVTPRQDVQPLEAELVGPLGDGGERIGLPPQLPRPSDRP